MKIEGILKYKIFDRYCFILNGKDYTIKEMSSFLEVPLSVLYHGCKTQDNEHFKQWLKDILWKKENGIKYNQKVSIKDGKRMCSHLLIEMTGVTIRVAADRIKKWREGYITYERMIESKTDAKIRAYKKREKTSPERTPPIIGLRPRKSVEELGEAGTWERNLPEPESGMHVRSRGHSLGRNSSGSMMRGD